jgi:hypothetical protein
MLFLIRNKILGEGDDYEEIIRIAYSRIIGLFLFYKLSLMLYHIMFWETIKAEKHIFFCLWKNKLRNLNINIFIDDC